MSFSQHNLNSTIVRLLMDTHVISKNPKIFLPNQNCKNRKIKIDIIHRTIGYERRREGDLNSRSLARTRFMVKIFPGARPTRLGDPGTSLATNVLEMI